MTSTLSGPVATSLVFLARLALQSEKAHKHGYPCCYRAASIEEVKRLIEASGYSAAHSAAEGSIPLLVCPDVHGFNIIACDHKFYGLPFSSGAFNLKKARAPIRGLFRGNQRRAGEANDRARGAARADRAAPQALLAGAPFRFPAPFFRSWSSTERSVPAPQKNCRGCRGPRAESGPGTGLRRAAGLSPWSALNAQHDIARTIGCRPNLLPGRRCAATAVPR